MKRYSKPFGQRSHSSFGVVVVVDDGGGDGGGGEGVDIGMVVGVGRKVGVLGVMIMGPR